MGKINGAQLLVKALKAEGVGHVFGLAGVGIFPIFDACLTENVRIIDVRHETAGVFMAGATARITGEPAVCVVTEGPGHANAIAGLTTMYAEDTPVVLISGCAETENWGRGAIQEPRWRWRPPSRNGRPWSRRSAVSRRCWPWRFALPGAASQGPCT